MAAAYCGDDDSSCDDTYISISMTPSRDITAQDSLFDTSEDRGILKETSRLAANRPRSSSSTPQKKHDYGENDTAGVLDKLKKDIDSLALIKSQSDCGGSSRRANSSVKQGTWGFSSSQNPRFASDPTKLEDREIHDVGQENFMQDSVAGRLPSGEFCPQATAVAVKTKGQVENDELMRQMKVLEREKEWLQERLNISKDNSSIMSKTKEAELQHALCEHGMITNKLLTSQAKNNELSTKYNALLRENEQLQKTVREAKDDFTKISEHNEVHLREFSYTKAEKVKLERTLREVVTEVESKQGTLSEEFSNSKAEYNELFKMIHKLSQFSFGVKMQLRNSKFKEEALEQALHEVTNDVKRDQGTMIEKLEIAHKLSQSEVALMEEMLKNASEEIAEKTESISNLKRNTELLQSTFEEEKKKTNEAISKKNNTIYNLESNMDQLKRSFEENKQQAKLKISEKSTIICNLEREMEQDKLKLCKKIEFLEMSVKSNESRWLEKDANLNRKMEECQSSHSKLNTKTEQISEKLINTESLNRDLEDQADKMKLSLHEAREESQELIRENHDLNKVLLDATEKHRKVIEKACNLEIENALLQKDLLDATEENRTATEKLSNLEIENAALKRNNNEKDEANSKLELVFEEATASMDNELDNVKAILESKTAAIAHEKEAQGIQIEKLSATLSVSKSEKCASEAALKLVKASNEELNKTIVNLKSKVHNKEKQLADMVEANEVTHKKVSDLQTEINKMGESKASLEAEVKALRGKVQDRDKQLIDMNESSKITHKKLHDLNTKCDESQTRASNAKHEFSSLQSKLTRVNESLEASKESKLKLKKEAKELMSRAKDKECTLSNTINTLRSELAETKRHLNTKIDESQTRASNAKHEVSSLQSKLNRVNESLEASKENNLKLKKKAKELMSRAQDKECTLSNTINTLRSELAETKRNLEKTNAKLSKSNTQLTSALQSLDEMMKYIEKMRDDNDEAVEILEQDLEKAIKMKHNTENGMKKR